jgi:hypothetical protein
MKKLFHNIEISPVISIHGNPIHGINHCTGPIWPDFNNAGFARHHWGSGRGSIDIDPLSQGNIATHLKGLYIWWVHLSTLWILHSGIHFKIISCSVGAS